VTQEDAIIRSLRHLKGVYEARRAPGTPEWEEVKPRVERYLKHLFSSTERVS